MDVWDLYFSSLCAWRMHPGYQREGTIVPSLEECAELADEMVALKNRREFKWVTEQLLRPR